MTRYLIPTLIALGTLTMVALTAHVPDISAFNAAGWMLWQTRHCATWGMVVALVAGVGLGVVWHYTIGKSRPTAAERERTEKLIAIGQLLCDEIAITDGCECGLCVHRRAWKEAVG